jgi:hypothetical protein
MGIIGLMVTLLIFIGCSGGGDLLDEPTNRYHGSVVTEDNGEDTTNIDVVQTADCDGDLTTSDPEPFTVWNILVTVDSDSTGDIFNVESYTVTFRPFSGSSAGVAIDRADMPVLGGTLNPISRSMSLLVSPGTSSTIELPVWTAYDKGVYLNTIATNPNVTNVSSTSLSYDIQVVLNCRTSDDDTFQITTPWAPVDFGNYDNC